MTSTPPHDALSTGPILAVVGPTASGKTALAEELAVRLGGEIVSADSMQIYRGMDVGTAKPTAAERRVAYHCLDLVDPGEPFSAALYQRAARAAIADCHDRAVLPVVCGGTGLYVRAALDVMEFPAGDQADNDVRERYEAYERDHGSQALHALLAERDPASAEVIHPNNVRRVIRALEMSESGESYAEQAAGFGRRVSFYSDVHLLGLHVERHVLYDRIDARVDGMMTSGLLDEVRALLDAGLRDALTAAQAIGYKELVPVVEGAASLDDAVAAIKQASRRYAKRQITWFAADPRIKWLDVTTLSLTQAADAAIDALEWTAPT